MAVEIQETNWPISFPRYTGGSSKKDAKSASVADQAANTKLAMQWVEENASERESCVQVRSG